MEFRRWGNLAPQKHKMIDRFFHSPPVESGIYAFPLGVDDKWLTGGYGNVRNGRCSYVRDEEGKKIMMTYSEFDSLFDAFERNEDNGKIIMTPVGFEMMMGYEYSDFALSAGGGTAVFDSVEGFDRWGVLKAEKFDANKKYALVRKNKKPTKFEYRGNIWHHLEVLYPEWYYDISQGYVEWDGHNFKRLVRPEDIIRKSGSWILTEIKTFEKAYTQAMHIYKYNEFMRQKRDKSGNVAMVEGRPAGIPNNQYTWEEFEVFIEKIK